MDVRAYNRDAWDRQVEYGNPWTLPVSSEEIARARLGDWKVYLTELRPVPAEWFAAMSGLNVLCLACGGGQQGPLFAAAGACVTVYDNSPQQLAQDRMVAQREGLEITTVEGDMRDLSALSDGAFDMVFHPVSNVFVPEVAPVWREAYRVLRPGGVLLAGFMNPAVYLFDFARVEQGALEVANALPFDSRDLTEDERYQLFGDSPVEFSHSLEEQIGGQLAAGFMLTGLYESNDRTVMADYMSSYIATRAVKPGG